jgi:hypothetical protein
MQQHEEAAWPETYSQDMDHQAAPPPGAAPKQPYYTDAAGAAAAGGGGAPPRKLAGPAGGAPAASQRPRQQAAGQGPRSGRSRFQTMSVMSGAARWKPSTHRCSLLLHLADCYHTRYCSLHCRSLPQVFPSAV